MVFSHTQKKREKRKGKKKDKKNHPSEVTVSLWASRAAVKEAERGLPEAEAARGWGVPRRAVSPAPVHLVFTATPRGPG